MTIDFRGLSANHPLRTNPDRPWPYAVMIGYRGRAIRSIVTSRTLYVRATSASSAKAIAMREALASPTITMDGKRLKASRPLSARPLDRGDCIGAEHQKEIMHDN